MTNREKSCKDLVSGQWKQRQKDLQQEEFEGLSIDYVKPLLQNKDGLNDLLAVDIANIDLLAKQIDLLERAESFLASKLTKLVVTVIQWGQHILG